MSTASAEATGGLIPMDFPSCGSMITVLSESANSKQECPWVTILMPGAKPWGI